MKEERKDYGGRKLEGRKDDDARKEGRNIGRMKRRTAKKGRKEQRKLKEGRKMKRYLVVDLDDTRVETVCPQAGEGILRNECAEGRK